MSCERGDSAQKTLRLVEYPKLPQYSASVVVDALAGQPILLVKGVYAAQGNLDAPSC